MSHAEHKPLIAKFSDMDLRVGQRVQLIQDDSETKKYYSNVIGYVENEFLILRVPQEDGWIVHLREGMKVEVRLFSGLSIFTFKSNINTLLLNPRNYMLMSFPKEILETPMRAHLRVRTSLPVNILQASVKLQAQAPYRLNDLSGGGASVIGPEALGKSEDHINIGLQFELSSTGKTEYVEIQGTIQHIEPVHPANDPHAKPEYLHGIKFKESDARIVLLVHELQQKKQT